MNLNDVNRLIEAHNAAAHANALQARAWEEVAWGMVEDHAEATGVRPAIPVQVIDPDPASYPTPQARKPETLAAEVPVATAQPEPTGTAVQESVSLVELRTLLAELSQAGHTDRVRALIVGLGFDKLSEVPESQYAELFAQAVALREEVCDEPAF